MATSSIIRICAAALGSLLGLSNIATSAGPAIRVVNGPNGKPVAVEGVGLDKEYVQRLAKLPADDRGLTQIVTMYVVGSDGPLPTAIAGKHEVIDGAVRFTPQFSLRPGMRYEVHLLVQALKPELSLGQVTKQIVIPAAPPAEPTQVTAIYPSAATLPENQLRFYLQFSAPMRQGEAYEHVHLLKASGEPVKRAFLEIGEELWDPTGTRLTLLFDPGRVKQGLLPREEFGPVLVAGQEYRLVIDKPWRDATGQPLAAGFEKRFQAGPMIDAALDHTQWKLAPPVAGTREPLVVKFPRPLDHALLKWAITVENAAGKSIDGKVAVADDERRWEFRPDQPWAAGDFSVVADTTLEDSAGNNLTRPFEVDVFRPVEKQIVAEYVRLPFRIGAVPAR